MQKQSRVFFQISGAGHEALGLALARHLRPGYDWFFPYYRDQALVLGLGVTPKEILLQAVGSAEDPCQRRPPDAEPLGSGRASTSSPSRARPAASASRRSGAPRPARYIVRRPELGLPAHGDELTYVSLGEGACSEGEFWESLNTACNLHLPVLYVVPDNGFAISVPVDRPAARAGGRAGGRLPRPRHPPARRHRLLRRARRGQGRSIEQVRAGVGPGAAPLRRRAAVLALGRRHPGQVPLGRRAGRRGPSAIRSDRWSGRWSSGGVLTARARRPSCAPRPRRSWPRPRPRRSPRPDPIRRRVTEQVYVLPSTAGPAGDVRRWRAGAAGRGDQAHAPRADGGRRADPGVRRGRRRRPRGRAEPTSRARAACSARRTASSGRSARPAATTRRCRRRTSSGRAVGQAIRGLRPAPEIQFFDYIWPAMTQIKSEAATIRWRSNGAFTCPTVIRVPDRRLPHRRRDLAQPVRREHLRPRPRAADRLPVAGPGRGRAAAGRVPGEDPVLFLEHKHLLRQPYTVDPLPAGRLRHPVRPGRRPPPGRRPHDRHLGGDRREERCRPRRGSRPSEGFEVEVVDLRTISPVGPGARRRVAWPARTACSSSTRTCSPRGSAARWRRGRPSTASPTSTRPSGAFAAARHPRGLRADARAGDPAPGGRHRPRLRELCAF